MSKVLTIARTEIIKHVRKPSFWITTLALPFLIAIVSVFSRSSGDTNQAIPGLDDPAKIADDIQAGKPQVGFVDLSGLVSAIPASFPAQTAALYRQYDSEQAARAALTAGDIPAFYIIPADYLATGELTYYSQQFNPFGGAFREQLIETLLATSLTKSGDVLYARHIINPTIAMTIEPLVPTDSSTAATETERENAAFTLGYGFAMVLYVAIFASSSLLLQALIEEKENRVIEVMLSSVSPKQMLRGKIAGLGVLGLVQLAVWLLIAAAVVRGGSSIIASLGTIRIASWVWALAVVCFALGYLIYASLMSGIGAVANTMRESSQLTIVVILPIIIPLIFLSVIVTDPNGIVSRVLSYVPLTAPIVLVIRAAIASVPFWEIALSLGLMVLTVIALQAVAARMFRATTLLSGAKPSLGGLWKALRA